MRNPFAALHVVRSVELAGAARTWLAIVMASSALAGTGYVIAQQALRRGADEPQVQMAEEAVSRLRSGASPTALAGSEVDMARSLSPWLIVYNGEGRRVAGSATLDGGPVDFVKSALSGLAPGAEKRLTWAPRPSVRAATVVVAYPGGWVVAGRSLREIEQSSETFLAVALLGWLAAVLGSAAVLFGLPHLSRRSAGIPNR